jgi:hypothetical protein
MALTKSTELAVVHSFIHSWPDTAPCKPSGKMLNREKEIKQSKVYKESLEAIYRVDIFCRKSGKNAKLAVKKHQLREAKKTFGLDYLTLLEKDASYDELDECLREGHMKVGLLNKDIQALRAEKKSLDELLQAKLARVKEPDVHKEEESSSQSAAPNDKSEQEGISGRTETDHDEQTQHKSQENGAKLTAISEQSMDEHVEKHDDEEEEFVVLGSREAGGGEDNLD